jgi:CheY-like chemotaxis protein
MTRTVRKIERCVTFLAIAGALLLWGSLQFNLAPWNLALPRFVHFLLLFLFTFALLLFFAAEFRQKKKRKNLLPATEEILHLSHNEHEFTKENALTLSQLQQFYQSFLVELEGLPCFEEAIIRIIPKICSLSQWNIAAFWEFDNETDQLKCVFIFENEDFPCPSAEFLEVSKKLRFTVGRGFPGRAWKLGRTLVSNAITKEFDFVRYAEATKAGLNVAMAFPVQFRMNFKGVLEFYATEDRTQFLAHAKSLDTLGKQLGMYAELQTAQTQTLHLSNATQIAQREIEAAAHSKKEFMTSVCHQLRTPLTSLLGFSDLLLDAEQPLPERLDCVVKLRRNGERLLGLLQEMSEVSMLDKPNSQIPEPAPSLANSERACDKPESAAPRNAVYQNLNEQRVRLDGLLILVVDDAPDNRLIMSKFLKLAGASVELAKDGREGVEKALMGNFDIVLMDIQMPEKNGYEATSELRTRGYCKPILAVTAHAFKEEREKALSVGCNDHLAKPINRQKLLESIAFYTSEVPNTRH